MRYQHFDSPKYFFRVYGINNFLLLRSTVHSLVAKTGGKKAATSNLHVKHHSSHLLVLSTNALKKHIEN